MDGSSAVLAVTRTQAIMRKHIMSNVTLAALAFCAFFQTGLLIRREFAKGTGAPEQKRIREWRSYARGWVLQGDVNGGVTIVEFSDFQCPYCRRLATALDSVVSTNPQTVRVIYRYYPLEAIHPYAFKAAVAAQCAGEQGRLKEYHDILFSFQREIGTTDWSEFAKRARVADVARFSTCLGSTVYHRRITEDIADAKKIGARGTPTILINDMRYSGALDSRHLNEAVAAALGR